MVQSRLTRVREQNHSFTSGGTCVLRRFVQGSAGLSSPAPSPAPSPAVDGSSPAGSAAKLAMPPNEFCDCGHRELHRLPTLPPRWWIWPQLFNTAVHGVDELAEPLSPINATGRPPNTTCTDTRPWEQDVPSVHGATRDWHPPPDKHTAPATTTNAASVALHDQKNSVPQTLWMKKHCNMYHIIQPRLNIDKQSRHPSNIFMSSHATRQNIQAITSHWD